MGWKQSKFNVETTYKGDYWAIHNLLTHKGVLVRPSNKKLVGLILADPNDHVGDNFFNKLVEKGLVIDEYIDEIELIEELKNKVIKDKKNTLTLTIIPTYQCNFKCIYCWERTKDKKNSMNLEAQNRLLKFIELNINKFTSLELDWFGGEPLLAFEVMKNLLTQIDTVCKKNKIPYSSSLTTNGYCLSLEVFKFLLRHHTHFFQVTVDGPRKIHNTNRPLKGGSGTFDKIVDNLLDIKKNITEQFFQLIIRLNVTNETYLYHEEFLNFIKENFGDDKRFRLYIQKVECHNDVKFDLMKEKYLQDECITEKLCDACIEKNMHTSTLKMLKPGDLMCKTKFEDSLFVNSDGSIYKCDMDMNREHVSSIGEINEEGILEINTPNFNFWQNNIAKPSYCYECKLLPLCFGLKCPYYNTLNPQKVCELYNDLYIVRNAIKTYAQEGRYEIL
jgi:uncharacterized protein